MMLVLAVALMAQTQAPDLGQRIGAVRKAIEQIGPMFADSVWPGFRPDTIPVLYVFPNLGTMLAAWRGDLPAGFTPVTNLPGAGWQAVAERGAASTGTRLAGRPTAQVVVRPDAGTASLVGLTAHEAFHVFEGVMARDGRRFGAGENSLLIARYPVFDATNEAGMALEGRLLHAALREPDTARRRALAREFVAARDHRQRRLDAEFASFEQLGELNEGLAEYVLVRTSMLLGAQGAAIVERSTAALDSLTHDVTQSLRLRFYVTGPAQGRLLDALEGQGWKSRLLRDDLTLQEALAMASGARAAEQAALRQAESAFAIAALRARADADVGRLRGIRAAQIDTLLGRPGVSLTIAFDALPGRPGWCGFDPQNLLQADAGVLLHTRTIRFCAGPPLDAAFTTAAVEDRSAKTIRAVIGEPDSVRITSGGNPLAVLDGQSVDATDVRVETPVLTLRSSRATLERRGRELILRPKP